MEHVTVNEGGQDFDVIEQSRRLTINAEYHFSTIRGRIDNIAADGISREEMKPWLK